LSTITELTVSPGSSTRSCRWDVSFGEVRQQMNVHEKPVGHHDQRFDVMLQQHFQVAFESVSLVMCVCKNLHVRGLIQGVSMPRRTGMQNGSAISKNMTPTLWLRLLRRNRAIAFGRYPSFFATSSMRFFVAGAM